MFENVIGQEEVKALLRQQIESERIPHAQLFCGPEGSGKLAMAIGYAQALLGTSALVHPDLHYVFPVFKPKGWTGERKAVSDDFIKPWQETIADNLYFSRNEWASTIGLEGQKLQIGVGESEQILRKLSLVSSQGGWKVMIVWLAEFMSEECANKVLKILEEPTPRTAFILVCNQPERLLQTITSRTQRIDFRPLSNEEVATALQERRGLQPQDAMNVARLCNGNFTKACLSLQFDEDTATFFDMFVLFMRIAYGRKLLELNKWSDTVGTWSRERVRGFLDYTQHMVRENFMFNFRDPSLNYMQPQEIEFALKFAPFIHEGNILGIMEELETAQRDIEQNTNTRMVMFDLGMKFIVHLRVPAPK